MFYSRLHGAPRVGGSNKRLASIIDYYRGLVIEKRDRERKRKKERLGVNKIIHIHVCTYI